MAWNRSSNDGRARSPSAPRRAGTARPAAVRGAIAGAIVVLGAAIAAWWLWPAGERAGETPPPRKEGLIKEVKPQLSAEEQEKLDHPGMVKVRGKWYPEYNEQGGKIWISKNWVRYHTPVISTSGCSRVSFEEKVFRNAADRDIAVLINREPGTMIVGNYTYGERFVNDFLRSLKTPIIVTQEDDERTAALKRAVNEAKIELKARYDAGEDIGKIMDDTRKEMRELGAYRAELNQLVQRQLNGADADAVKDIYEAANKMLTDRGVKPLRMPTMLLKHLELQQQKEKLEQKGN